MRNSSYTGRRSERRRSPDGSGVNREVHAPFCERPEVKLLRPTHPGASTNLARKGGRCRRGRRLRVGIPHGHYKTITLVAGLRLSGLVAQKAHDRPIDAAAFEEWVEKCLAPTLSKGEIVVMDNLSSHKGPKVEQLIEAAGAEMRYLPALQS